MMKRIEDINPFIDPFVDGKIPEHIDKAIKLNESVTKEVLSGLIVPEEMCKKPTTTIVAMEGKSAVFIAPKIDSRQTQRIKENPLFDNTDKTLIVHKSAGVGKSWIEEKKQIIFGTIPSKSNCYRIVTFKSKDPNKKSHATLAKTKELAEYEKSFYTQCNLYRNLNIEGEFELEVYVYYPSRRADLDNSLKVLLDCLQKINAIRNDNNCIDIHAKRFVDKTNPRIEFTIKPSMS
jgi:Holliday junction resolvase RusA-like endonuclease